MVMLVMGVIRCFCCCDPCLLLLGVCEDLVLSCGLECASEMALLLLLCGVYVVVLSCGLECASEMALLLSGVGVLWQISCYLVLGVGVRVQQQRAAADVVWGVYLVIWCERVREPCWRKSGLWSCLCRVVSWWVSWNYVVVAVVALVVMYRVHWLFLRSGDHDCCFVGEKC